MRSKLFVFFLIALPALLCAPFYGAQDAPAHGTTAQLAPPPAPPAKMAEQVYKDIQALKGTPADQLMPAMKFMNIALGVQCEHCHLPGSYESANANKTMARAMIKMQAELTSGIFDKVRLATCWTCHRGSVEPPTLPVVATDVAPVASHVPETGVRVTMTAEQVFDRWVQAAGGAEALSKLTTRVLSGTMTTSSTKSPVEVLTKSPDKRLSLVHAPDGESITAFDGRVGWVGTVGRGANEMAPEDSYAAMLDATLLWPLTAKQMFERIRIWKPEKLNGRDTNVVLGSNRGRPDIKLYFDKETGRLAHVSRVVETPIGQIPTEVAYEDYRTSNGVTLPMRWTIAQPQGEFTIQIERVQQNVPIDDGRFEKPQGVVSGK